MSLVVEIRVLRGEAAYVPSCTSCGRRGPRIGPPELLIVEALELPDPIGQWFDGHSC